MEALNGDALLTHITMLCAQPPTAMRGYVAWAAGAVIHLCVATPSEDVAQLTPRRSVTSSLFAARLQHATSDDGIALWAEAAAFRSKLLAAVLGASSSIRKPEQVSHSQPPPPPRAADVIDNFAKYVTTLSHVQRTELAELSWTVVRNNNFSNLSLAVHGAILKALARTSHTELSAHAANLRDAILHPIPSVTPSIIADIINTLTSASAQSSVVPTVPDVAPTPLSTSLSESGYDALVKQMSSGKSTRRSSVSELAQSMEDDDLKLKLQSAVGQSTPTKHILTIH